MKTVPEGIEELVLALRARHGLDPFGSETMRARFELALAESAGNQAVEARVDAIALRLRVGATRFFRDGAQLEAALAAIGSSSRVRVLSAGSSTGEEAYTIAMLLASCARDLEVLGIDVRSECVAIAREGRYLAEAVATLPPRLHKYVIKNGEARIAPSIAARCRFVIGDLLTAPLLGPFDAIFCRNVLIYLEEDVAQRLLGRLTAALSERGVLVVARAEVALARRSPSLIARTLPGDVVVFDRAASGRKDASPDASPVSRVPLSRVRLVVRPGDHGDVIAQRAGELLAHGAATIELTVIGTCDATRLAEIGPPLRRLASAARALGGVARPTDDATARVLRDARA
jgi:chemotaxis protein methyltransferase CheR